MSTLRPNPNDIDYSRQNNRTALGVCPLRKAKVQLLPLRFHALAVILAGLVALPDKLADFTVFDPVFVQVAAGVVDHVQPAIPYQPYAHRSRGGLVRQGQRRRRVEPLDQAIAQR